MAVINGTLGDDTLDGTTGDDLISGLAGNDTIHGSSGNDWLDGGDHSDFIHGGIGNDTLEAEDGGNGGRIVGENTLIGGLGDDVLLSYEGSDSLDGGEGHDRLSAGAGNDTLVGGAGEDIFFFSRSFFDGDANVVSGGTGRDVISYSLQSFSPFQMSIDALAAGIAITQSFGSGPVQIISSTIDATDIEKYVFSASLNNSGLSVELSGDFAASGLTGPSPTGSLGIFNVSNARIEVLGTDQVDQVLASGITSNTPMYANGYGGDDYLLAALETIRSMVSQMMTRSSAAEATTGSLEGVG